MERMPVSTSWVLVTTQGNVQVLSWRDWVPRRGKIYYETHGDLITMPWIAYSLQNLIFLDSVRKAFVLFFVSSFWKASVYRSYTKWCFTHTLGPSGSVSQSLMKWLLFKNASAFPFGFARSGCPGRQPTARAAQRIVVVASKALGIGKPKGYLPVLLLLYLYKNIYTH